MIIKIKINIGSDILIAGSNSASRSWDSQIGLLGKNGGIRLALVAILIITIHKTPIKIKN